MRPNASYRAIDHVEIRDLQVHLPGQRQPRCSQTRRWYTKVETCPHLWCTYQHQVPPLINATVENGKHIAQEGQHAQATC